VTTTQQRIGRTDDESEERWPELPSPGDHPNVLVILLDDVGFSQLGCFGSSIETPHIDQLATGGLRFANFHTTAVCSPTRASLLTGRNCHAVGFGHVTERVAGYPGYSMRLPEDSATLAEVLRGHGYATRAVGKWHLTPSYETGPQGPFDRWPLARGFDRYYGFLGGSTDQFAPELVRDNSPVGQPYEPEEGYHLSGDLAEESMRQLTDLRSVAPRQPFFLYLAFGACHAPHQAPQAYIDAYRGRFDHGWDEERRRVLARQVELGLFPGGTELGSSNPGVECWENLGEEERTVFARMMEVYAAYLTYTDAQIGRLLGRLEDLGVLDDTLVLLMSDNGASGEGGPEGSVDEGLYLSNRPQLASDAMARLDDLGGPRLYNHYPWGWAQAGNTPFRWYKQFTHAGGITNGLVVHWPAGGVPAGEVRHQYHHVIDIMPTVLDLVGVERPAVHRGVTQAPLHGVSMRPAIDDARVDGGRHEQHYEMWGNRGLWHDGWMAVCRLHPDAAGSPTPAERTVVFDDLPWELYDHRADPTECHDLATDEQQRLRALVDRWWAAAGRYDVLPVDTRPRSRRWPVDPPRPRGIDPEATVFLGPGGPFERGVAPRVAGSSFRLRAEVVVEADPEGCLIQVGGRHGGYCWYLRDGRIALEMSASSIQTRTHEAAFELVPGAHVLECRLAAGAADHGRLQVVVDDRVVIDAEVEGLLRRIPIGAGRTYVGRAGAATVSGRIAPPAEFTGQLTRLTVTLGDDRWTTENEELSAEMRDQ